ncbi:MAG TPA: L-threonylcarbamoyladenylate synthase [Verrucomicrobiae bacterium]|nr:L-threonylcarbamoyladenylate synthase [Verrucomicrobiae bacterium]
MPALVLKVGRKISPPQLKKAAFVLKKGGVAILPSDTVYGLAASVKFPAAVRRIAKIKGRKQNQPFSIFVSGWGELLRRAKNRPAYFLKLKTLLPGPYTFVLPARAGLPKLCVSKGKVGLRWPDFPLLSKLVKKTGAPLVATSANRTGKPPLFSGRAVIAEFRDEADLILDSGKLPLSAVSTVVEFLPEEAIVWRKGAGYKKLMQQLYRLGVPVRDGG